MSEEAARIVVWVILLTALVVWMFGVRFVARVRNAERPPSDPQRLVFEQPAPAGQIVGQVTVPAPLLDLPQRLARALAQPQISQLGAMKILDVDDERVSFEQVEPDRQSGVRLGPCEVRFVSDGSSSTVAHYRLATESGRGRMFAASVLLACGLAAIVGTWALMEHYVIPNLDPQVRWQSLQALQVAHLLWPPFQLASVHRASRAAALARIEALLANLPHLA